MDAVKGATLYDRGPYHRGCTPILHPYIAGALLTAAELLGPAGPELDPEQISQLFDLAWRQRDHRDKMIRQATLALMPKTALHCAESRWWEP